MKLDNISRSVEILNWSIDKKVSIAESCRKFKVNPEYVNTTIKRLKVNKSQDDRFKKLLELHQKAVLSRSFSKLGDFDHLEDELKEVKSDSLSFNKETGELDAKGVTHVKTLEQLLVAAKVDTRIWEVDRHVVNKWDVTNSDGKRFQNWQVKAWLKRREEVADAINFEEFYRDLLAKHKSPVVKRINYKKESAHWKENLLEVNIFDLHLGKLCWSEEVNNNYDTKIASRRFKYALEELVTRASGYGFERILFPVGNDFFNSDSHINTTTGGTRQDEDSRWQKTFKTGEKLLIEAIEYLKSFAPVDVLVIPGNHDWTKTFFLGETLAAYYHNDKNVVINNSANPRKYYEYGQTLLGFTHGNNEKPEALRSLMAHEAKQAWARTAYKEFHVGHQHRKISYSHTVKSNITHEELGIVVRHMSSLAGTDSWHHTMGYIGPTRAAEAFIWGKEVGLIGTINSNILLSEPEVDIQKLAVVDLMSGKVSKIK